MSEPANPSGPDPDKPPSDPSGYPPPGPSSPPPGPSYPPPGQGAAPPGPGYPPPGPSAPPPPGYPPPGPSAPPPGAGYPPPGPGHPPPGQGPFPPGIYGPRAGYANQDDRNWALISHFGGAAGAFLGGWLGFLAPLVALMARGKESPTVRAHAVSALNFQITWIGVSVALSLVICCATVATLGFGAFAFVLLAVPWLVATIFGVIAGIKANEGELYRYPMSIGIVK